MGFARVLLCSSKTKATDKDRSKRHSERASEREIEREKEEARKRGLGQQQNSPKSPQCQQTYLNKKVVKPSGCEKKIIQKQKEKQTEEKQNMTLKEEPEPTTVGK